MKLQNLRYEEGQYRSFSLSTDESLRHLISLTLEGIRAAGKDTKKRIPLLKRLVLLRTEIEYRKDPYDLGPVADEFEGHSFPLNEMWLQVRSIHEGLCPECGRQFSSITEEDTDSRWEWLRTIGRCAAGHEAVAEPNESDSDWVAWVVK